MRRRRDILIFVMMVVAIAAFICTPVVHMRFFQGSVGGAVGGHVLVSPSFYLLGCGVVYQYWYRVSVSDISSIHFIPVTWLCKTSVPASSPTWWSY